MDNLYYDIPDYEMKVPRVTTTSVNNLIHPLYGKAKEVKAETIDEVNSIRKQLLVNYQKNNNSKAAWELLNTRYILNNHVAIDLLYKLALDLQAAVKSTKPAHQQLVS